MHEIKYYYIGEAKLIVYLNYNIINTAAKSINITYINIQDNERISYDVLQENPSQRVDY